MYIYFSILFVVGSSISLFHQHIVNNVNSQRDALFGYCFRTYAW